MHVRIRYALTLSCLLLSYAAVSRGAGITYYVATNGSDSNPGTAAQPFSTLQRAIIAADPGDVIELRQGTYQGGVVVNDANITIRSFPNEWAHITAPTNNSNFSTTITFNPRASGGRLQRIEVSGGEFYTVKMESVWDENDPSSHGASNIVIEDCKLHGSGRDVVKITPASNDVTIQRCEIYNSGVRDPSNAEGIDNTTGDRMIAQENHVHDIATTGIYAKGGSIGTKIRRNLVRNIRNGLGIEGGQYTAPEFYNPRTNPEQYESRDIVIENNIVVNTAYAGIALTGSLNSQVRGNTIVNPSQTGQPGIMLRPSQFDVPNQNPTIENNIVMLNSNSSSEMLTIRGGGLNGPMNFRNNLFYDPRGPANFWNQTSPPNGYQGGLAGFETHVRAGSNNKEGNPLLDASFHLSVNSPARASGRGGTGLALDYDGNPRAATPDIGADQFSPGFALAVPPAGGTLGIGSTGPTTSTPPPPPPPPSPSPTLTPRPSPSPSRSPSPLPSPASPSLTPRPSIPPQASPQITLVPPPAISLAPTPQLSPIPSPPIACQSGEQLVCRQCPIGASQGNCGCRCQAPSMSVQPTIPPLSISLNTPIAGQAFTLQDSIAVNAAVNVPPASQLTCITVIIDGNEMTPSADGDAYTDLSNAGLPSCFNTAPAPTPSSEVEETPEPAVSPVSGQETTPSDLPSSLRESQVPAGVETTPSDKSGQSFLQEVLR